MRRSLQSSALPFLILIGVLSCNSARAYTREAELARGRYLVAASDCLACHTNPGGTPLAGNRPIETPFGVIYSSNITPDDDTGIGAWSRDEFYRALHEGLRRDGEHLYPAMPYPQYTKLSRDDVDAMYAYLRTIAPVRQEERLPQLPWPLSWRKMLAGWNWMFFKAGEYQYDVAHNADWNRGAYLVEGPGHCGACHTPKNFLGAAKRGEALQGGALQNWFAPMLIRNRRNGLGAWTQDEIVQFLKVGRNDKTAAFGPMTEVIADSTSKLRDEDLRAIAVYLESLGTTSEPKGVKPDRVTLAGEHIFAAQCAACHQINGEGVDRAFATLQDSSNVQQERPDTVIHAILSGVQAAITDPAPTGFGMPAYDWKLTDEEVAAVATYVRNAWGNAAPPVSASDVKKLRAAIKAKSPQR
jgi:mono/diheme cytochrome c family protein